MATPGYTTLSKTKESGAPKQVIPPKTWVLLDLGMPILATNPEIANAQTYFEEVPSQVHKMAIRMARGNGNPTAQHDFLVKGPTWAISHTNIDFVKDDSTDDGRRGIEVWSELGCVAQTRIMKAVRPVTLAGDVA